MRWLKLPLGVVSVSVGGAALAWDGAATLAALTTTGNGFQVTNLIGAALGCAAAGFGFDCFGWLRSRDETEKNPVANSVWAKRADIERAGIDEKSQSEKRKPDATKEGIYLGVFKDAEGEITLRYDGGKSLLSFGTPGANKSTGLVVCAISELLRSLVIIDVKAELASITARKRALMGRVIVLNPFGLFLDELPHLASAGWNPMLQLDCESDDFTGDAFCIAEAMIDKAGG